MNRMKFYRGEKRLSVANIARKLDYSEGVLRSIENGRQKSYPKIRKALSGILEVPESEIFTPEGWVRNDEITDGNSH